MKNRYIILNVYEKQYKRVGIIIYYISSSERLVLIRTIFIKNGREQSFFCFWVFERFLEYHYFIYSTEMDMVIVGVIMSIRK